MVQVLQKVPSFGEQLGQNLGSGFGAGLSSGIEQRQKRKFTEQLLGRGKKATQKSTDQIAQDFQRGLLDVEKQIGRDLKPNEVESFWDMFQKQEAQAQQPESDFSERAEAALAADRPDIAKYFTEKEKLRSKENLTREMQERKERFAREQESGKQMKEAHERAESLEESSLRFERLNELFSPELESQFPPALMTAMLTKHGELTPLGQSTLSPDAQEAVKLITDEIRGAKDTFGSRVTNFDAQTYLKTLPNLLNTADGRRRVLRDLRIMNKINQSKTDGVLDVMDRYGPGEISYDKALNIFRKESKGKMEQYRKAFIHPNEFPFTELDDFNASIYPGITIEDPESGQRFSSNGREWVMD